MTCMIIKNKRKMKILNKIILPLLVLLIIVLIIREHRTKTSASAVFQERTVEYTLQLAGENRPELEKVLQHYRNDSLKYLAAEFLIGNMADCSEERWLPYRNKQADSIFSLSLFENQDEAFQYMDSLHIGFHLQKTVPDYKSIHSSFLINHIDRAFALWERDDNRYLSFNNFKETLLPYRVDKEKLENSSEFVLSKYDSLLSSLEYTDKLQACINLNNQLKKEIKWNSRMNLFPGSLSCDEMNQLKTGHCDHLTNYGLKVFRAAGIAVGRDFVSAWGDNDAGHSWNVLFLKDKLIPFAGCGDNPGEFPFFWRAPKVSRKTFQYQHGGIWAYKSRQQEVPEELSDHYHIDVTSQYYETVDIEVPLKHKPNRKENCAFLCVYNRSHWQPVDWGKIDHEKQTATFTNINDSLLYCVMYYNWMQLKPATAPFWVASADSLHFFEPEEKRIKLEKIFDYNYFQWNKTQAQTNYGLKLWKNGTWQDVGKGTSYPCVKNEEQEPTLDPAYSYQQSSDQWDRVPSGSIPDNENINYFIDFDQVPANGLYLLETESRPFWIVNGKMAGRFPFKEWIVRELSLP